MPGALGRLTPPDFEHVEKYPLSAAQASALPPTPVAIGVNWYSNFDRPQKDSRGDYWIGKGDLGRIRGGHCVCLKPAATRDVIEWWDFYDQGAEGACVGFGVSRALSLMNRRKFFARWLWDRAKEGDVWADTNPGDDNGTSVRSALAVTLAGHVKWRTSPELLAADRDWRLRQSFTPDPYWRILQYRWATNVQDALNALGTPSRDYVTMLNSWGRSYPHVVYMPAAALQRLLDEDGEIGLVVDSVV